MAPAVWFLLEQMQSPEREGEKKNKKERNPPAGHHFHWQLVNKLKKRDAGTIPPPSHLFPLFTLLLSCCRHNWCFPKKKKKRKKIFLEVMDFSGAGIGGRDISLRGGPQRWFSPPFNSIHTFWPPCSPLPQYIDVFIGMEKGISRDRLAECFCFLDLIQWCVLCQDTEQKCNFSCWMWEEKLKKLKGIFTKEDWRCDVGHILHLNRLSFFSEIWILALQALKRSWIHLDRDFLSSFHRNSPQQQWRFEDDWGAGAEKMKKGTTCTGGGGHQHAESLNLGLFIVKKKGHLTTFCPQEGQPRRHRIIFVF